jgi:starch-binding outer membrane protein, SusD/RagB family
MRIHILNKIAFVAILALSMAACDKALDLEPQQSIDESTALQTDQDVKVTLTGAYDALSGASALGGTIQYMAELLGDDREVVFGGTFSTLDELWRKTITTTNGDVSTTWSASYNTINRANNVLSALDKVIANDKARVEGEARFIRGVLYFNLAALYGKAWGDGDNAANPAVPLVLTPTRGVSDADYRRRNSVAEVYAQAIDDLTKAEGLLPVSNDNPGFASKAACAAFLSRIYLMQQNYTAARDAANRAIGPDAELAATYADAFSDANSGTERIFALIVSDQDGVNDMNTFFSAGSRPGGRGDIRVQQKHFDLYETGDARKDFYEKGGANTFSLKHAERFGDVNVIRLAEMHLTRAECNFRLSTSVGASVADDVNAIRKRAGLGNLGIISLDAILKERRLELAHEGQQIHDRKRTRTNVGTIAWNANALVLPIPQREIDTNKNLTQNPGY